mmetsp:Transcript_34406/g.97017  ORF Transcript_34406/g.97017 Transcript_34406/m.97017 type:complete len:238 (+) Transcript_34406:1609-2322(+)
MGFPLHAARGAQPARSGRGAGRGPHGGARSGAPRPRPVLRPAHHASHDARPTEAVCRTRGGLGRDPGLRDAWDALAPRGEQGGWSSAHPHAGQLQRGAAVRPQRPPRGAPAGGSRGLRAAAAVHRRVCPPGRGTTAHARWHLSGSRPGCPAGRRGRPGGGRSVRRPVEAPGVTGGGALPHFSSAHSFDLAHSIIHFISLPRPSRVPIPEAPRCCPPPRRRRRWRRCRGSPGPSPPAS